MPVYPIDEVANANNFVYHAPFGDQVERYQQIRDAFRSLAETIQQLTPPSRERSVALTNLETAMFWTNAGVARNEKPTP